MLTFERGTETEPKGHALLYFQDGTDLSRLVVTYVLVLPIAIDLARYMPPILTFQMGQMEMADLSAFAFPPIPEHFESRELLQRLAEIRGDDILFGGTIDPSQVQTTMATVNDTVESYAQSYSALVSRATPDQSTPAEAQPREDQTASLGVAEVLFQFMDENDRLAELSRLTGKLRFAVEGRDQSLVQETEEEIQTLSKYLTRSYSIEQLVKAVRDPSPAGAELASLYLNRCFKLQSKDIEEVQKLDQQISAWHASENEEPI